MKKRPMRLQGKEVLDYGYVQLIDYVSRWRAKGGIEDLRKARHYIDLLIETETGGTDGK